MKVAHLVSEYLPRSQTFVYTLLRFERRYRPVVITRRTLNLTEFAFEPVVEVTPNRSLAVRAVRAVPAVLTRHRSTYEYRARREMRRRACVAAHAHFGWAGHDAVAGRRPPVPLVTSFYGVDVVLPERSPRWRERYERLFDRCALVTALGPVMSQRLIDLGCPPEKIRLMRLGVDLDEFVFEPRSIASPLIVLQIARLVPKKGFDVTIRAFAEARAELGPAELWIVGDGVLRDELERLARECSVADSVRFFGALAHVDVRRLLRRAHIGVQPSRTAPDGDVEGTPTVILEFQAVGLPVIATRHADIESIVAFPGDLVPENDVAALAERVVQTARLTTEERDARVRVGREFVEGNHDGRLVAAAVEAIYDELLER
jgi:colanic acid/amylovoran biosynthesis glycosyltransferase